MTKMQLSRARAYVLAASALIGSAAVPLQVSAQDAERCSVSVKKGKMPAFSSKGTGSRIVNSPLLEENAYIAVSMPESYAARLAQAGRERPAEKGLVAEAVHKNIEIALGKKKAGSAVSFECAPVPSAAAPGAKAPERSPATQTRQTDRAPAAKTRDPIPPSFGGGKGAESNPYVINVPVISGGREGAEITKKDFHYVIGSDKVYFRLRFAVSRPVPAGEPQSTKQSELSRHVVSLLKIRIRSHIPEASPSDSSLTGTVSSLIREAAAGNESIGRYAVR